MRREGVKSQLLSFIFLRMNAMDGSQHLTLWCGIGYKSSQQQPETKSKKVENITDIALEAGFSNEEELVPQ